MCSKAPVIRNMQIKTKMRIFPSDMQKFRWLIIFIHGENAYNLRYVGQSRKYPGLLEEQTGKPIKACGTLNFQILFLGVCLMDSHIPCGSEQESVCCNTAKVKLRET